MARLECWPVGDSITIGLTDFGAQNACGYRDWLYTPLQAIGDGVDFVGTITGGITPDGIPGDPPICPVTGLGLQSDGHSGFLIAHVTSDCAGWYASLPTKPDFGILDIGTNDLIAIIEGAPGFDLAKAISDFNACLAALVALDPSMTWFVTQLQPMTNLVGTPAFAPYNANIAAQVASYKADGYKMFTIDLTSGMNSLADPAPGAMFNSGGIHPNLLGYQTMANIIFRAISAVYATGIPRFPPPTAWGRFNGPSFPPAPSS